jgi:CDGSH-type Zn-finger protein
VRTDVALAAALGDVRAGVERLLLDIEQRATGAATDLAVPPDLVQRLRRSVLRPLDSALATLSVGRSALSETEPPAPDQPGIPGIDARIWELAQRVTHLIVEPGTPVDVREAAAALQHLACAGGTAEAPDSPADRLMTLRRLQRSLDGAIVPLTNGPLLVTKVGRLSNWLGEPLPAYPQLALCRCGHSAIKPLCDGSHSESGFTDLKDPKRVPDRLDTYPGQRIVVTDNRGTCAHSGFCTDSLPGAFHASGDPFVTPTGAREDEIIRAVRACPSGALGYALAEGDSLPDQVREAAIEVSRDGPYRVTGSVPLLDGEGRPVPRNQGASMEHYSLCRCGQSRNKPFCSGMHWYIGFVDPERPAESTLVSDQQEERIAVPELDGRVSFDEHIKGLFRSKDRASMQFAFDLWSYADVSANAAEILDRVSNGSMPCDSGWPPDRVETFRRWIETGMRESASSAAGSTEPSATEPRASPPAAAPQAIEGPLGRALALRSSAPVDEPAIVIEHREPLIYMLCAAAELEHALMCEYLFAAFSLKRSVDEGLTEEQLAAVNRWRSTILLVAKQEMMHLAINCNLVTSLGASPHLSRANLPQPAKHYPAGVRLALLPFGEQALRHFLFLERPEGMDIEDAEGLKAVDCAVPLMGEEEIAPHLQEFRTVGHLYRSIEAGFRHLADKMGEEQLFLGPGESQARGELFGWKELAPITSCDAVTRAIEAIVEQGEGPRGDWRNAHFGRFLSVLDEYLEMKEADPGLEVTRPVLPVLVRPPETGEDADLITDPTTARVADLCNVAYEVLLQLLYRLMCQVDEIEDQVKTLADVGVSMMFDVIEPLAEILTTLPVGSEHPGRTAGATFELFYQPDYLLPHRRAAWLLMAEHLADAATLANSESSRDPRFQPVAQALRAHADALKAKAN